MRWRAAWAAAGVGVAIAGVAGGAWAVARLRAELDARGVTARGIGVGVGGVRLDDVDVGPVHADRVDVDVLAWAQGRVEAVVTRARLARPTGGGGASGASGGRPVQITLVDASFAEGALVVDDVDGIVTRDAAGRWHADVTGAARGLGVDGGDARFEAHAARAGEDRLTATLDGLDLPHVGAALGRDAPPGQGRAWVDVVDDHAVVGFEGEVAIPFPGGAVTAPTRVVLTGARDALVAVSGPVVVDVVWDGIPARALGDLAAVPGLLRGDPDAPIGPPSGPARPDAWVVALDAVPVGDVLQSPPIARLDPRIASAHASGTLSVVASIAWTGTAWELDPLVDLDGFAVTGFVDTGPYRGGPFQHAIRDAAGARAVRTTGEGAPGWTPRGAVPEPLVLALLAAEDSWFFHHRGYSIPAQRLAWHEHDIPHGLRRGGSTLTQQLAKNLVSGRDHAMRRKLVELLTSVQFEHELGKRRILELYLNIVELGPGIYGVGDGARAWFGKPVSALTPGESLWLVLCLPSPRRAWRDAPAGDGLGEWAPRFEELRVKLGELGVDPASVTRPRLPPR